jgi:hypothetical protein
VDETVAEPDEKDTGVAGWVWWVLAALVVGAAVAVPLGLRARRRSAWQRGVEEGKDELAWLARELLPELRQAGSREAMAGGWAVSQARVVATEDRLTALEAAAPDEAGRRRALSFRDAARHARVEMDRLTGPEPPDMWVLGLDAIIADLEQALRPSTLGSTA